jgi:antitoxin YefM
MRQDGSEFPRYELRLYEVVIDSSSKFLYCSPVQKPERKMAIETTYTQARASLARLMEEVTDNRETVIIHRRGGEDVALIAADELRSLRETAHLLRSPANARRLLAALARAQDRSVEPRSVDELRHEVGLEG